ncbi:MAG TPA: DUF4139 domain-containing protein [Sorangium sp.]|nr:DUF4139 domain-containing protein [Sorangium sp.]
MARDADGSGRAERSASEAGAGEVSAAAPGAGEVSAGQGSAAAPGAGEEGAGQRSAAERAPHPSAARAVTLFEDRAEVVRRARVDVEAGAQWVAIGGVSVFVDERTVQARVAPSADADGAVRVTAARVRWRAHREAALGREAIDALEREQREASRRAGAAELERDRASRREAHLDQLLAKWAQAMSEVPKDAGDPARLASWRGGIEALRAALADALAASAEARAARAHAEDDARRAATRLREGSLEQPRYEAVIEVEIHAPAPQPVEIELTYRVACAIWRPEHLARLSADAAGGAGAQGAGGAGAQGAGGSVELTTWATAWQATGEAWENVAARFSTARPARTAEAPLLADDVLRLRRKTDLERRRVVVEARDQAIAAAGLGHGARTVDEMPGVDDGGEPLIFEAAEPVTLPSDGRPLRVEIARRSLPAELALVLYPEAHPAAHLRATVTLDGGGGGGGRPRPLLAGPVRVARGGSLVGRARLDFVGAGEPFELGFGVDDAVRVRRTVDEEQETAAITGSRKIRRRVKLSLSNLSSLAKRVLVTERIPVSKVAEVEVALGEAPGWTLDEKDGFLRGRVELPPRGVKTMAFTYELRAGASVVLPF